MIVFSSFVDYFIGIKMGEVSEQKSKKLLMLLSIIINLGLLGFFKYYNFFVDSFVDLFELIGITLNRGTLTILLPVGISFYTFQTLSYSIDIYRNKLKPTKERYCSIFCLCCFFPSVSCGTY